MNYLSRSLLCLPFLALTGCGENPPDDLPPLQSVTGVVVYNGKPLKQALVQFSPDNTKLDFTINGLTNKKGHFELSTISTRGNVKKQGAPDGRYSVLVIPAMDADQSGLPPFPPQIRTVKNGKNHFKFEFGKK